MVVELEPKKRSEVAVDDTWNLSAIFRTPEDWESAIGKIQARVPVLETLKGRVGDSSLNLLSALKVEEEIGELLSKVYAYAALKKDEDTADTEAQANADRVIVLNVEVSSALAFLEPEILEIEPETVELYIDEQPGLKKYKHALDNLLRTREHVLDSETETLLASAGELAMAPSSIFGMLNDADMRYGSIEDDEGNLVELTKANYSRFLESRKREVRRSAFEAMHDAYQKHRNTIAAAYAASVKKDVFFARTRNYGSALESALFQNNIPVEVYDNLVDAVNDHLDLQHRYFALRKELLGVDRLGVHDLYVPIVPEVEEEYSYDAAEGMVLSGLSALGSDYVSDLGAGLDSRWVDKYENQGKRSGAYSWGVYGAHPFILLNWSGQLRDVFTLAHEAGHAMHSHYTSNKQPFVYAGYTIFVAEVASTVNELLLTDTLRKNTDDKQLEMYLINNALDDLRATLFRQTQFAEFERWSHDRVEAGSALTADAMSEKYAELCAKYYGPDVDIDEFVAIEWARIPHFYRAFYVYQYATGISAAVTLSRQILHGGEAARNRYRTFLSAGSSKYSLDLLRDAGVDMTTPGPVEQALETFGHWLDELETMLES